jgi:hypothetical protein
MIRLPTMEKRWVFANSAVSNVTGMLRPTPRQMPPLKKTKKQLG